jgi:Protein of unknown function (DUF3017)
MDEVDVDDGRSLRPPVRTEGVLRPEGGRRAASGDAPAPARQWPMLLVVGGVALGLLVTLHAFRAGLLVVGGFVLVGTALRVSLPNVGLLAVRSRFTDVVTLGVLGSGIVLLALMAMPRPILEVPWLTDALRFVVR